MTVLMNHMRELIITVPEAVYQRETSSLTITFLVPSDIAGIGADGILKYTDLSGTIREILLEKDDDLYKSSYVKYTARFEPNFVDMAGQVEFWLVLVHWISETDKTEVLRSATASFEVMNTPEGFMYLGGEVLHNTTNFKTGGGMIART